MTKKITLVFTLATAIYLFTGCNDNTTTSSDGDKKDTTTSQMDMKDSKEMKMDDGLMNPMNKMMEKMSSMKMSEDFDMDFANMMIEHHQGAIDMSEAEIKSGKDEKMKSMAQSIISMQKEEQSKLKEIVKNSKPMKMGGEKHDELSKGMDDMKADMSKMQMTGNIDKDFAMMMVSHHESAIKMSKVELSHGMNAQLKQMAKKIIADQTKEIGEFKSWMATNK